MPLATAGRGSRPLGDPPAPRAGRPPVRAAWRTLAAHVIEVAGLAVWAPCLSEGIEAHAALAQGSAAGGHVELGHSKGRVGRSTVVPRSAPSLVPSTRSCSACRPSVRLIGTACGLNAPVVLPILLMLLGPLRRPIPLVKLSEARLGLGRIGG